MARASKKPSSPPPSRGPDAGGGATGQPPWALRAFDAVFRFLASLNLAVISLSTLVVYLTAGMVFERSYGNQALQDYFYRTWYFALLLGVLGMNILCAALIRYPWKKRQTGFVVTHAGLLVLILGSWIGFQTGDEGQVAMVEGDSSATLVRTTKYRIRVQPVNLQTMEPTGDGYAFPIYPGAFNWKPGTSETLGAGTEPFQLSATGFYPASAEKLDHRQSERGRPMIRLSANLTPPGSKSPMDLFQGDFRDQARWLVGDPIFRHRYRSRGPAAFRFTYADESAAEAAAHDFLDLPEKGTLEVVRLRYSDRSGKERLVRFLPSKSAWILENGEERPGRSIDLPDSDLKATYRLSGLPGKPEVLERLKTQFHLGAGGESHSHLSLLQFLQEVVRATGDSDLALAEVEVARGASPGVVHIALPFGMVRALAFVPSQEDPATWDTAEPLLNVSYYHPPDISEGMEGARGTVDVLGTAGGKLYYRSLNREGVQGSGPLKPREEVVAFGGTPNMPVTLKFSVDDFLESGVEESICVPIEMPVGQAGNGIPAVRMKLSKDGESDERWLQLAITTDLKPMQGATETFLLGQKGYQVWFDVDRKPLPFDIELVDFRRRYDPGVSQVRSYESDVLLTDESQQIDRKEVTIAMNEPLTHRGYTFYQSSFDPPSDTSGKFVSIFNVRYDPTWGIVYLGCLMVVLGTFLQFYMRAGVFTDGGKRERERDEARRSKSSAKSGAPLEPVGSAATAEPAEEL